MPSKGVTLVKDIKPYKTGWRIHVKVVHTWRNKTKFGGESLEMILADETGVKIHASCKQSFVPKVQRELPINEWRVIDNFNVSSASGHYRATTHPYKIAIISATSITLSDLKLENPFLSLTPFQSITKEDFNNDFLIDVFGQVVDVGDMQTVQVSGKERKKCEFYLRDTSDQRIPCCLWGRFAEQIQESCQEADTQIILCLIRFAKITFYRGDLQITNSFETSDVQINPTIPESDEYIKLLSPFDVQLVSTGLVVTKKQNKRKREVWLTYPVKTLAEMLHSTEVEKCRVTGTIYGINTDWAWFYFGCCKCTKKVTRINNDIVLANTTKRLWRCNPCDGNVLNVALKFKLHLLVKDDNNETKMMLLDSEAQKVVGYEAEQLWDGSYNEIENPELLPKEINGAVGKTFQFGVQIGKENVNYGAESYKISKVWTLEEIVKLEAEAAEALDQGDDQNNTVSSTISSDKVSTQCEESSEDTSYGLSTSSSKRKEEVDVLPDLNSTTKKQCIKLIKVEKDASK